MPSDAELLKAYLADRDVPCPGCGYSLKGCAAEKCPECGHSPVLGIQKTFWTPGRVRLLRATLLVCCAACGYEAVSYARILLRPGTFAGITPSGAAIWIVVMTIHTLLSLAPAWGFWQTMRIHLSQPERRLNRAFVVALCEPLVRGSVFLIQMVMDEFL